MQKVLIANRGEIAVRVIGACAQEGMTSVAIYADGDAQALHTVLADEAYALEGISPAETYLNIEKILTIAKKAGADAVHPGYGFLAENAGFAQQVMDAGLTWIGPSPETITALGDKVKARDIALAVNAPLAPGTDGPVEGPAEAREFAEQYGLPIVIKAAHGGGGRGMRVVRELDEIESAFESAQREAIGAFGNGECFVERFLDQPRHVETQVAADQHGGVVVLGTRDCSLQRRHQKLVEEAPAPFLSKEQIKTLEKASKDIFAKAGYVGVGTCEFLIANDGTISFLEVNTRIQVEHPVTEESAGVDLVRMQLDIAAGEPLAFTEMPEPIMHAFEFRINAEDPGRGFLPSAGTIEAINVPTGHGIRWDSGVRAGTVMDGSFDSMLAKLIVTGTTRERALRRAQHALKQLEIQGVATVIPFDRMVVEHPAFKSEDGKLGIYTTWIENELGDDLEIDPAYEQGLLPVGAKSMPGTGMTRFTLEIDGTPKRVGIPDAVFGSMGSGAGVAEQGEDDAPSDVTAPMGGVLIRYTVEAGAEVEEGAQIALLEAMKTEVPVYAEVAGTIDSLPVAEGERVNAGTILAHFA
ncbi:MAG: biotin carboxylase N-terminal domain-containing protein [Rothia sp. (in: high G+C Gram-positive bacteria)]|nr:biotin carboxylase N-terminal domain-containing protein [Rothia sp. (in: high G+C Gram-positive bacteria)]